MKIKLIIWFILCLIAKLICSLVQSQLVDSNSIEFDSITTTTWADKNLSENKEIDYLPIDCGTLSTNAIKFTISNPDAPEPTYGRLICEIVVQHSRPNVSKLSLKLRQMLLYRPTMDGQCLQDKFAVFTDLNRAVTPIMCGNKTGETIIVPFDASLEHLIVSIITSDLDHDRNWFIEVEQV